MNRVITVVFCLSILACKPSSSWDATITWKPPVNDTLGAPAQIQNFKIYVSGDREAVHESVSGTQNAFKTRLGAGTYIFHVTAVGVNGAESERSEPLVITFS